jgi:hypothetical protein
MSKLSSNEKWLAGASGLMLLLFFVPRWASYPVGLWLASVHGSDNVSAMEGDFATTPIAALMTFAIVAALALKALGAFDPGSSTTVAKAYIAAAAVAALGVFLALAIGPAPMDIGPELEGERGPLPYVGLLVTIAMVVTAVRHLREVQATSAQPMPTSFTAPR